MELCKRQKILQRYYTLAVCYFYSADRKGERPKKTFTRIQSVVLRQMSMTVIVNYKQKKSNGKYTSEAAQQTHTSCKFYEIAVVQMKKQVSLHQYWGKYLVCTKIESDIKDLDPSKRLQHRQRVSKGIVDKIIYRPKKYPKDLLLKSTTAKAIAHAVN